MKNRFQKSKNIVFYSKISVSLGLLSAYGCLHWRCGWQWQARERAEGGDASCPRIICIEHSALYLIR